MKRRVMLTVFIAALLIVAVTGTLLVNLATANPFFERGSWCDDSTLPVINVQSPLQNQTCSFGQDVWLKFTVTPPLTSWHGSDGSDSGVTIGSVSSVQYFLDGQLYPRLTVSGQSYSANIGALSEGQHTIKINAQGLGHSSTTLMHDIYRGSEYTFRQSVPTKRVSSSVQISFIVLKETQPEQTAENQQPTSTEMGLVTVATASVTVLSIGFSVYLYKFKKRKAES